MGDGRRHRRKNARREREASPAAADEASDDVLELVFMRLTSLLYLIRAVCTCKRWRGIVATAASSAGSARSTRPPWWRAATASTNASDIRSALAATLCSSRPPRRRPSMRGTSLSTSSRSSKYSKDCWELADCRGGLLLLLNGTTVSGEVVPSARLPLSLVVCEPLTRRYRVIPPSAWSHGCQCFGAFLLDGDVDEAGGCISLSNFRLVCALYGSGIARACVFSSDSSRWTIPARKTAVCGKDYWMAAPINDFTFEGSSGRSVYWRMGSRVFGHSGSNVLVLEKDTAEFSSCVDLENAHFDWQTGIHVPAGVAAYDSSLLNLVDGHGVSISADQTTINVGNTDDGGREET